MSTDALTAYKQQTHGVADALDVLAAALDHPAHAQRLSALAARTREGSFRIVLLGCFSSGKSTLLNALLGRPVLPVKVNPCTAVLTEVRWADTPQVDILYTDERTESLSVEAFVQRFVLDGEDPDTELDRFTDVARAIVGWPLPLLRNGVVFVDTPGLDDDPQRTERTLRTLPHADAVVVVLNATRFLTALERDTIHALEPMGLQTLFFPIAMTDLVAQLADDPDAARAELSTRAHQHLDPLVGDRWSQRVHWLDGRGALKARYNYSEASLQTPVLPHEPTGVPGFERELQRFLIDERGAARLRGVGQAVRSIVSELTAERSLIEATERTSLAELSQRRSELAPQLARLDAVAQRVARLADAFVSEQSERIWADLCTFLAETEDALPDVVADIDVGGLAGLDLLIPSGRTRVEARLRDSLQRWLDQRLSQWRERCLPQLNEALLALRSELASEGADFDAVRADVLDAFTAGVRVPSAPDTHEPEASERWFAVAIGAVLLSPGTVAAGWTQGYEGALKGAAGRLGARIGVLALGALLGPVGWAGLVVYVLADTLLLVATGGSQLSRTRARFAAALRGRLVQHAHDARPVITEQVSAALGPFRDALVQAATADATTLRQRLDAVVAARADAHGSAEARNERWQHTLAAIDTASNTLATHGVTGL